MGVEDPANHVGNRTDDNRDDDDGNGCAGAADADDASTDADDPAVGLRGCSSCLSTTSRLGADALTSH